MTIFRTRFFTSENLDFESESKRNFEIHKKFRQKIPLEIVRFR